MREIKLQIVKEGHCREKRRSKPLSIKRHLDQIMLPASKRITLQSFRYALINFLWLIFRIFCGLESTFYNITFAINPTGLSKVAGCRRKSPPTWLVTASYSAVAFLYGRRFLNEISLNWPLILTSKLSDNPGLTPCWNFNCKSHFSALNYLWVNTLSPRDLKSSYSDWS